MTPVGAFSLKTVVLRVHARTVSVVNLAATQMTSQPPQLQRAMMRVSHKFRLLQGRLPLTQFHLIVKYIFIRVVKLIDASFRLHSDLLFVFLIYFDLICLISW